MVGRRYMEGVAAAPGAVRRVVDRGVVPALIDVAGVVEGVVERVAVVARRRPGVCLLAACLVGVVVGRGVRGRG